MSENQENASDELAAALAQARAQTPQTSGANKSTLILAGALLAVGGFVGGYAVHGATTPDGPAFSRAGGFPGGGPGGAGGPGGPGGGPNAGGPRNLTIGTITKVDGDTVTIKTMQGKTVQATIGGDTRVNVNKEGAVKDLAKGDEIVVNGERDGDTIEAEFVSKGRGFGPGARRAEGGTGAGG